MELRNRVGKIVYKTLAELENFQGNLKELNEAKAKKLEKAIKEFGYCDPVRIWGDKILDGRQRTFVLRSMGYPPETEIACVEIYADSEKEAKAMLLLMLSEYGRIQDNELHKYIEINNLDFYKIKTVIAPAGVNMGTFKMCYYEDPVINEKEGDGKKKNKCPKCGYEW